MHTMTRRWFAALLPFLLIGDKSAFASQYGRLPTVRAVVDIATQTMRVYVGGEPIEDKSWPVSTASSAHTDCTYGACITPIGTFTPTRIDVNAHAAAKWNRVPMPNAVYFDNQGNAIHAAYEAAEEALLGKLADSHGCVRLRPAHAKIFFDLVAQHERPAGRDRNGYPIYAYPGVTIIIENGQLPSIKHKDRLPVIHRGDGWI
jgi:hypothetical protein